MWGNKPGMDTKILDYNTARYCKWETPFATYPTLHCTLAVRKLEVLSLSVIRKVAWPLQPCAHFFKCLLTEMRQDRSELTWFVWSCVLNIGGKTNTMWHLDIFTNVMGFNGNETWYTVILPDLSPLFRSVVWQWKLEIHIGTIETFNIYNG